MTKKAFQSMKRSSSLLDIFILIYELNGMLTRGGNRYFITFIDDCSRFTYMYLIKYKCEAFNVF